MLNSQKTRFQLITLLTVLGLILLTNTAYAGMPSFQITLTDIAKMRLSTISFFLAMYLLTSLGIWGLWNALTEDFFHLPRLSFIRAMVLVLIWGLAFYVVLVMIAGTRELMTPKAWEKAGIVHKLSADKFEQIMETRRHKMEVLKKAVFAYAEKNQGKFPTQEYLKQTNPELLLEPTGQSSYFYIDGMSISKDKDSLPKVLAYESDQYSYERMTLLTQLFLKRFPFKM